MVSTQMALPAEFRKPRFADVSRTFVAILAASVLFHFGLMVLLLSLPRPPAKEEVAAAAQARLATLIVRRPTTEPEFDLRTSRKPVEAGEALERPAGKVRAAGQASAGPLGGTTTQQGGAGGGEPPLAEGHSRTRARLAAEVSSLGVLRVLTSGSRLGTQDQAQELIGAAEAAADLDATLGGLGGLKSTGAPSVGRELRGGRATEAGTIDTMVGELGTAVSTNVQRGGSLVVEPVTPLTKEGEVTTLAGRDPDQVSRVVNRHNDAIEYCYQKELKRNPTLKGRLAVRFTITPEGKVSSVAIISSTLNSPELENCIVRRIQRWDDFGVVDASLGEATFRQVYTFGF